MAKNEPNKRDKVNPEPANDALTDEKSPPDIQPLQAGEAEAPESPADKAAVPTQEGEAVLRNMGEMFPDPGKENRAQRQNPESGYGRQGAENR